MSTTTNDQDPTDVMLVWILIGTILGVFLMYLTL